jgi:hypothetical protein
MAVKKGRSGPNIGSHGTAIAVDDVSSSISDSGHKMFTFKPDPSDIPKGDGVKIFKFPLEDISTGNFWTRLIINSWVPEEGEKEVIKGQNHRLGKDSVANIWLPMPLALVTNYNQRYSDADNMMVNGGSPTVHGSSGIGAGILGQGAGVGAGTLNEAAQVASDIANVNSSGKMGMGSILNQQMGLVYDGASLREHTLSWRMIPKDREEQKAIETVCFAFKKFSSPVVKGIVGGEVGPTTSNAAHKDAGKSIEKAGEEGGKGNATSALEGATDSLRNIGRLGIPVTVNVEFWYGPQINPHLFQIKDSFIQSVEVNYTPTGVWNAYEDGAPVETQLTVALKENAIITQGDLSAVGGY